MKKAKIVLVAIAVFAVVGGALAFKAQKGLWVLRCPITDANGAVSCPTVAPYASVAGVPTTYVCPGFAGMFTTTTTDPLGVTCTGITTDIFTTSNQ